MSTSRDHTDWRFALVCSRFNDLIVSRLEHGARDTLVRCRVADDAIDTFERSGLPHLALGRFLISKK